MKRLISISLVLSLVMSFCVQTASAATIGDAAENGSLLSSIMNEALCERLTQAADEDIMQVTIELKDNINLNDVELKAVSRAKISSTEMAVLSTDTLSLTDMENESVQLAALKVYDRISQERNSILKEYYKVKNEDFISSTCIKDAEIGSVGLFIPFIRDVSLTKAEILEIAARPEVCRIDIAEELNPCSFDEDEYLDSTLDCQDVNDTYKIVGGDAFINAGYTGSGIRVGQIEWYHPDKSKMGSDGNNIKLINDEISVGYHPTMVSGIIKKFAPSCSIYSYALDADPTEGDVISACEKVINDYNVHVINLSIGNCSGEYTETSRQIDNIIRNNDVVIVAGAGNAATDLTGQYIQSSKISSLAMAGNVIAVGSVGTKGTNPDASDAFTLSDYSCYEETSPINKPDIVAPGYVRIYSLQNYGTSFAAPHVTGTVVQMMARNAAFVKQPQKVKAALLASATRNCGTSMSYIEGTIGSNYEGAGVLDAEFCYRLSKAGRATHFDATSSSDTFTHNVYCDYTTKPFRIACTWEVAAADSGSALNVSDYNLMVYKNGTPVAWSFAPSGSGSKLGTNNEIIEIPTSDLKAFGGGYYEVEIYRVGSFKGSGTVRIGLAWEQD